MKQILNFILGPSISFKRNKKGHFALDLLPIISLGLVLISILTLILASNVQTGFGYVTSYFKDFVFTFRFDNILVLLFYISLILILGLSITLCVFNEKKHVCSIRAIIPLLGLLIEAFFIYYLFLLVGSKEGFIITWLILEIPQFFLLISLALLSSRLFVKFFKVRKLTSEEKEKYYEHQTDRLLAFLKFLLDFVKGIGLAILKFFKNIGIKLIDFVKNVGKSYTKNTIQFYSRKDKSKDKINVVVPIVFIFAFLFFYFIEGGNDSFVVIGRFINTIFGFNGVLSIIFFILFILTIGFSLFSIWYLTKKHYLAVMDTVSFALFMFTLMAMIFVAIDFNITSDNAFIYVIMSIPSYILLFTLSIRSTRLFIKLAKAEDSKEREEDYRLRKIENKKIPQKFLKYMKKNWGQVLVVIALLALAVAVLYPLLILLMRSFKYSTDDLIDPFGIPDKTTWENFVYMWSYLKDAYVNSLITTLSVTFGTVILASFAAFAFIRFRFPCKNLIFYSIIGLMMIPGILTLISRFQLVDSMGMVGSLWGIILPGIAGFTPMAFMLLYTFFKGVPKDLFEAADIDGASDFSVFLNVVTPLSKPIISTIAIQTFVGEWNDYLWAYLIVGSEEQKLTLPVLLQNISQTYEKGFLGMSVPFAGYVLSAIPLIIIFIVASKQFIEGLTSGAFKM